MSAQAPPRSFFSFFISLGEHLSREIHPLSTRRHSRRSTDCFSRLPVPNVAATLHLNRPASALTTASPLRPCTSLYTSDSETNTRNNRAAPFSVSSSSDVFSSESPCDSVGRDLHYSTFSLFFPIPLLYSSGLVRSNPLGPRFKKMKRDPKAYDRTRTDILAGWLFSRSAFRLSTAGPSLVRQNPGELMGKLPDRYTAAFNGTVGLPEQDDPVPLPPRGRSMNAASCPITELFFGFRYYAVHRSRYFEFSGGGRPIPGRHYANVVCVTHRTRIHTKNVSDRQACCGGRR